MGVRVRYRLLGNLEVERDDGVMIPISAPKRRALLAFLLLQRGHAASREQVIDALWGDAAPDAATESLFAHMSRLRRELGNGAIESVPGGYVMPDRDRELDIEVFEREVAAGRRAVAEERWFAASTSLAAALGRWRSSALADVAVEAFAQAEISRLDELYLTALEDRVGADLELQRHRLLVPELEQLVRLHPLRERLWGQLMLALYRSERQSDALERYRDLRRILRHELGLDPSPQLQELQRQVLRQDPALVGGDAGRVVVDLPEYPTRTMGRNDEVRLITEAVRAHRLVTLVGPGGVGKTRLAVLAATALVPEYPDGTQFVDMSVVRDPWRVLERIGSKVGGGDRPVAVIGHRRFLLVLDNFEQVLPGSRAVAGLLARCPNLHVIATSRAPLRIAAEHAIEVGPLGSRDAIDLFRDRAAPLLRDRSVPDELARAIVARLDGLPLAVELAAARVGELLPPSAGGAARQELSFLASGSAHDRHHTLSQTIRWSYELLSGNARPAFRKLSVLAPGFDITAAMVVAETGMDAVAELVDHHLLRRSGDRYSMLETIREFAEAEATETEAAGASARHVRHFTALPLGARELAAQALGSDLGGADIWLQVCTANDENLRLAFERASGAGDIEAMVGLLSGTGMYLMLLGRLEEALRWGTSTLERSGELRPEQVQRVRLVTAEVARFGDRQDLALELLRAALDAAEMGGDLQRAASTSDDLAFTYASTGAHAEANALLRRARQFHRLEKSCDPRHLRHTLETEIFVLLRQGRIAEADATAKEYAGVDVSMAGWTMRNFETELAMAAVAEAAGRWAEARAGYERVVVGASGVQFRGMVADALDGLAGIEREERPDHAARLLGIADRARAESRLLVFFAPQRAILFERLRQLLGPDAFEAARRAGELVSVKDAPSAIRIERPAEGPVL
jgi:predicted ATPase/DNA-binding SARP family transcriptional activator